MTEAESPQGEVLGWLGLEGSAHAACAETAAEQVNTMIASRDVHERGLRDDVTSLIVRVASEPVAAQRVGTVVMPKEAGGLRFLVNLTRRQVLSPDRIPEPRRAERADGIAAAVAELATNRVERGHHPKPGPSGGRPVVHRNLIEADRDDSGLARSAIESAEFDRQDAPLSGHGLNTAHSELSALVLELRTPGARNGLRFLCRFNPGGRRR